MSVVASYARVSAPDLDRIRSKSEAFWQIAEMPWDGSGSARESSQRLEIDKMWEGLSWLCSPLGRAEAHQMAALINVDAGIEGKEAFKAALAQEVAAMGLIWVDPDTLPTDAVLAAIQGRRDDNQTADIADFGLHATVFTPDEVQKLSSALNAIDLNQLRERFDVREIEALGLPGDWEESELDEFYLPSLDRLKRLYADAAATNQHVVVVFS